MWDHYKKTLIGIQFVIAMATLAVYFGLGRSVFVGATFFVVMQVGSVVGSWWADRLKKRINPQYSWVTITRNDAGTTGA